MITRKLAFTGVALTVLMLVGTMEYRHLHQQADIFMKQIEEIPIEAEVPPAVVTPIIEPDVYTPPMASPVKLKKKIVSPHQRAADKIKPIEAAPIDKKKVIAEKPATKESHSYVCDEAKKYHDMFHGETEAGKEALKKMGHTFGYTDAQMTAVARKCHLD